jgi:hypothetical protein
MITKEEALVWYHQIQTGDGTSGVREEYCRKFPIGSLAERHWNDGMFTLGVEYGILIAIAKIFGLTTKDLI